MRRLLERLEHDEPALAIHSRAAGERDRECQVERRDLPPTLSSPAIELDDVRFEQVVGGIVIAMLLLDTLEDREIALRPEMHLEPPHAVDDVVLHALAVPAVGLAARLPVAFENVAGTVGE